VQGAHAQDGRAAAVTLARIAPKETSKMTTETPRPSASADTRTERAIQGSMRSLASDATERVSGAVGAVRATADQVGERVPDVVETVRDGALETARTIESMPDPSQRLLAAFSLGLGLGLAVSGAPRVIVVATLAPAMFIASLMVRSEQPRTKKA
jgi:hypothetical protein